MLYSNDITEFKKTGWNLLNPKTRWQPAFRCGVTLLKIIVGGVGCDSFVKRSSMAEKKSFSRTKQG
jgi:hypothetical protein